MARKLPKLLETAVKRIKKTSPGVNPYAVGTAALQKSGSLKPGTHTATKQGVMRGGKSQAWRQKHPPK